MGISTILHILSWLVAIIATVLFVSTIFEVQYAGYFINVTTSLLACLAGYLLALFLHFQGRYVSELEQKFRDRFG